GCPRGLDQLANRPLAHALSESGLVEDVPGPASGLPRCRLDQIVLRPGDRLGEERLAALVEDEREPAVHLRRPNELLLPPLPVRHVAAVELVHSEGGRGAELARVIEPVALAEGICAQRQAELSREPPPEPSCRK